MDIPKHPSEFRRRLAPEMIRNELNSHAALYTSGSIRSLVTKVYEDGHATGRWNTKTEMADHLGIQRSLLWKMMKGDTKTVKGIAHSSLNIALLAFHSSLGDHEATPRVQSQLLLTLLSNHLTTLRRAACKSFPDICLSANVMADVVIVAREIVRSPATLGQLNDKKAWCGFWDTISRGDVPTAMSTANGLYFIRAVAADDVWWCYCHHGNSPYHDQCLRYMATSLADDAFDAANIVQRTPQDTAFAQAFRTDLAFHRSAYEYWLSSTNEPKPSPEQYFVARGVNVSRLAIANTFDDYLISTPTLIMRARQILQKEWIHTWEFGFPETQTSQCGDLK